MRFILLLVLGLLATGAFASGKTLQPVDKEKPVAAKKAKPSRIGWIASEDMPADAQRFDGKNLYLKVTIENGAVVKTETATAETANLTLSLVSREKENTMLSIRSGLDVSIKLDLYISHDNTRYQYTSSCPIMAKKGGYETWGFPINWFAVSDIRVVPEDSGLCE